MKQIMRKNKRPYSLKSDLKRFFYPSEYMKVEDQAKEISIRLHHTIKFLLNTGARINEARNVLVEDVDFDNKRMLLRVTKQKKKDRRRFRTVPLSTQFTRYLNKYAKDHTLSGKDAWGILSTPSLSLGLKKSCKRAHIKDYSNFSAHNLRKTLEVWLMALGVDSLALTAHIGHDLKTAAQYYVSPDVFTWDEKKQIRDIIGDLYRR